MKRMTAALVLAMTMSASPSPAIADRGLPSFASCAEATATVQERGWITPDRAFLLDCVHTLTSGDILSAKNDPIVCPLLIIIVIIILRPGVPGVIEGNEQGDIFVGDELFWDCPPYETEDVHAQSGA